MTNNHCVQNVTRRYALRFKQACRAVEQCTMAWVQYGVSVRDLTLAEVVVARAEQGSAVELPFAEVRGLRFYPPDYATAATREEMQLATEACGFVEWVEARGFIELAEA